MGGYGYIEGYKDLKMCFCDKQSIDYLCWEREKSFPLKIFILQKRCTTRLLYYNFSHAPSLSLPPSLFSIFSFPSVEINWIWTSMSINELISIFEQKSQIEGAWNLLEPETPRRRRKERSKNNVYIWRKKKFWLKFTTDIMIIWKNLSSVLSLSSFASFYRYSRSSFSFLQFIASRKFYNSRKSSSPKIFCTIIPMIIIFMTVEAKGNVSLSQSAVSCCKYCKGEKGGELLGKHEEPYVCFFYFFLQFMNFLLFVDLIIFWHLIIMKTMMIYIINDLS